MVAYLYILKSQSNGRYYIGSAIDPARRLHEHNSGYVTATKNKGPWEQIKLVAFTDDSIARQAEHYLKKQKSREATEKVIADVFPWPTSIQPLKQ